MSVEYLTILLPYSPRGFLYEIFDFLVIFLYLGIFAVPLLFFISLILMAIIREKHEITKSESVLNKLTVAMPLILGAIMLLTDFNSRLQ